MKTELEGEVAKSSGEISKLEAEAAELRRQLQVLLLSPNISTLDMREHTCGRHLHKGRHSLTCVLHGCALDAFSQDLENQLLEKDRLVQEAKESEKKAVEEAFQVFFWLLSSPSTQYPFFVFRIVSSVGDCADERACSKGGAPTACTAQQDHGFAWKYSCVLSSATTAGLVAFPDLSALLQGRLGGMWG